MSSTAAGGGDLLTWHRRSGLPYSPPTGALREDTTMQLQVRNLKGRVARLEQMAKGFAKEVVL
jgi:hypothetical protein